MKLESLARVKALENEIKGFGSKKGMLFRQIHSSVGAYLYEIKDNGLIHYETFKRRKTALCVSFEKREYSETEFKEKYPRDNDFGKWAWCYKDKQMALDKFNSLA